MKFRKAEQQETCSHCARFVNDPLELQRSFPGIHALSSMYGSTRGRSGICLVRETFQDPIPACDEFRPRS